MREGDHVETFYANMDCIAELAASLADAKGISDIHIQNSPYSDKIGDEILEVNNIKINSKEQLLELITSYSVNDILDINIL